MGIQISNESLIEQIERISQQEQRSPEEVIADAVQLYLEQSHPIPGVSFLLSIAGQAASRESDISERDEEILATEVDPQHGWRPSRDNESLA